MSDVATAVAGWLLTGGAVPVFRVRRTERDRADAQFDRDMASFHRLMRQAQVEQDADPETALFKSRYRMVRSSKRWPQLARLARNR